MARGAASLPPSPDQSEGPLPEQGVAVVVEAEVEEVVVLVIVLVLVIVTVIVIVIVTFSMQSMRLQIWIFISAGGAFWRPRFSFHASLGQGKEKADAFAFGVWRFRIWQFGSQTQKTPTDPWAYEK